MESRITAPYDKFPLEPDRQEIRLISIVPGKWTDIIECRLTTISLMDSPPPYEALSYVYGDEGHCPILLGGRFYQPTRNLYSALRRL